MASSASATVVVATELLNCALARARRVRRVCLLLSALGCGVAVASLCALTVGTTIYHVGAAFLIATATVGFASRGRRRLTVSPGDLAVRLTQLAKEKNSPTPDEYVADVMQRERRALQRFASAALCCLVAALVSGYVAQGNLARLWAASSVGFRDRVTLRVMSGMQSASGTADSNHIVLSLQPGVTEHLTLHTPNLVEIIRQTSDATPQALQVQLRHIGDSQPFQTFQLLPDVRAANERSYAAVFSLTEDCELLLPQYSSTALVAVNLLADERPTVVLTSAIPVEEPWPDEQPLVLQIKTQSLAPLERVELVIHTSERTSTELVNVFDTLHSEFSTIYRLVLEPYVDRDIEQVEIVARATDKASPRPRVGMSKPLRINTASAYGRYRRALQTLRDLKDTIDPAISENSAVLADRAGELSTAALNQAQRTPFFDALDRRDLNEIAMLVRTVLSKPNPDQVMEISERLNVFLTEHEKLDDRERDRDFFVAVRGLSRMLEQRVEPEAILKSTQKLSEFLKQRRVRWQARMQLIPDAKELAVQWEKVGAGSFEQQVGEVPNLDHDDRAHGTSNGMTELAAMASKYREWINLLEKQEDAARRAKDQQRMAAMVAAANQLRALQRKQGEVSSALDRATERSAEIATNWPMVRVKQNSNAKDTAKLGGQVSALAPLLGMRIRAAREAMDHTMKAGDSERYVVAESYADLAGRLLRKALKESAKEQRRTMARQRRRIAGDSYYGQSVLGGDVSVEHSYRVDRRYREDILNAIQRQENSEDQLLLESYLRKLVR